MAWSTTARNHLPLPEPELSRQDTALLVVDMQYFDAHPDYGMGRQLLDAGRFGEAKYYFSEVVRIIPNIAALQRVFREREMEVLHSRVKALTQNGRDITLHHRAKGHRYLPNTKEVEFLEELAPVGDEIVIDKSTTSCFTSTGLDLVLRSLGVRKIVVAGVDTCYCVESTIREAADLGYQVVLVSDGCATSSPEIQAHALAELDNDFCVVRPAEWVLERLMELAGIGRSHYRT